MSQPARLHSNPRTPRRQRGAITLFISMLVLFVITVMTMATSQVVTYEQRISSNELREQQAFQAAMTGLERANAYLSAGGPDQNGDGVADAIAPPAVLASERAAAPGGGTYAVELCHPAAALPATATDSCTAATYGANKLKHLMIYARGWSDDGTGLRHMLTLTKRTPGLADTPNNPLTTRGTAVINGSGDVTNPTGRSTVWAGQSVSFTNANFKTNILSPSGNGIVETSNRDSFGPDVIQNDGNLSVLTGDQFFTNFFGSTPTVYRNSFATDVFSAGDIGTYDGARGQILWAQGDTSTSGSPVYGTADDPVILIVDGNFDVGGTLTVNGLLYVTGNMSGTGNTTVNGAVVVQGSVNATGSVDIVFDSNLLGNLGAVGQMGLMAGSWKDWKEW